MAITGKYVEDCFNNIGNKAGIKTWRVQNEKLIIQLKRNFGTFHDAEIYILLETSKEQSIVKRSLYLWIGSQSNQNDQEEAMNIFTKAENYVGRANIFIHHQNRESSHFMDMFPNGIKYLIGYADQFRHFENGQYVKRMFRVNGKRSLRIEQVPRSYLSMNEGDSFILDDEWTLYCWNGRESNKIEKIRTLQTARMIRDQFCYGKAKIIIADSGTDEKEEMQFFNALGEKGPIKPKKQSTTQKDDSPPKLFRITKQPTDITTSPLLHSLLNSTDCYILDLNNYGLFGWIGARAKQKITSSVFNFVKENNYPRNTPIHIMHEGNELKQFTYFFLGWSSRINQPNSEKAGADLGNDLIDSMIDDASGPIKIWRVKVFSRVPWPIQYYGIFFDSDCYIVYYKSNNTPQQLIYIWQGKESKEEERAEAFHFAQELDSALNGCATQIVVVNTKEPEHFIRIFKGKLTILTGSAESICLDGSDIKTKSVNKVFSSNNSQAVKFFHIRGTFPYNTIVRQIPPQGSLLHSDDTFLLQIGKKTYVWEGVLTSEAEKDFAEVVADRIAPKGDLIIIQEGFEPKDFWKAVGGKQKYNIQKQEDQNKKRDGMRLYQCHNKLGEFIVKEIFPFDQKDLNADDVMILDNYNQIFIWVGKYANRLEKEMAWDTVKEFMEKNSNGRTIAETALFQIKQGLEPKGFTELFEEWHPELQDKKSYEELKRDIQKENIFARSPERPQTPRVPTVQVTPRSQRYEKRLRNSYSCENLKHSQNFKSDFVNQQWK